MKGRGVKGQRRGGGAAGPSRVLPTPWGACLGEAAGRGGRSGTATWARPALFPFCTHVQAMNFLLLLFWVASRGWGGGAVRGGGPWPRRCS